jgi:hypothetical protein
MSRRLLGTVLTIWAAILMMVFPLDAAWAEKRVALVVGNSNYENVPKLPNPSRDAISVGQMFRDAGFDTVDVIVNVSNLELKRAIRKFEVEVDLADIAVIFYAGHGLEIGGTNYLIPIDAKLASDRDADDEAITLERLVSSADGASKLRVIILDSCRDNPFTSLMRRDRKASNRVVSSGLGKIEPSSTDTLIAYAAKAGSTAEDGDGQHSPFTAAIIKNLTNPGLDIRLAFGRIRDEVMRSTGSRQEPFVYGSLGGGNISLVPAPKVQDTPVADIKADYELVAKVGTLRAWEVFLGTHKTGFYADLARAQMASLSDQQQPAGNVVTRSQGNSNAVVAGVPSAPPPGGRDSSSQEALDWNRIKDSSDPAAFEKFIQKYADAPLAINAQKRLEILKQAARERDAAQKAAERARIQAEQKKAREEDDRRAKAAEAEQKARAAEAERLAAKQRDEEERRAKAAEAEQKAKASEAERRAAEAKQKADEAQRNKAATEAAAARAESEKQQRQAEAERKKAEQASSLEAGCKTEQSKFDDLSARGSEGAGVENMAAFAGTVTCDRLRPQVTVTLNNFYTEAACKADQIKFDALSAKGSEGAGVDNMKAFARTVICDRLRPQIASAVDRFTAEAAKRTATAPNSPQLVVAAQTELVRLGCKLPGKPDGILNAPTKTALARFATLKGRSSELTVTDALVSELTKQTDRVCPLECKTGETPKGDACVAPEKPAAPATTSRRKDDEDRKPQPERRQADREQRRPAPAPEPRARQQAVARPIGGGGGGGGGGSHTMIGVGF